MKRGWTQRIHHFLERPVAVLGFSLVFLTAHLLMSGNAYNLLRMDHDRRVLKAQIEEVGHQLEDLKMKAQQARDPLFLEKMAKERLDMATEDELVFVFSGP